MKIPVLIIFIFCTLPAFAYKATQNDTLKTLQRQIVELQNADATNKATISNVLSTINTSFVIIGVAVAICTVLVTIGVVFLSFFISNRLTKINEARTDVNTTITDTQGILKDADEMLRGTETMLSDTEDTLQKTNAIKQEVQDLSDKIHNNISQLYQELQEEELKIILDELLEKPYRFNDYHTKLKSYPAISDKFLNRLLEIHKVMVEPYKYDFVKFIRRHFYIDYMINNPELFNVLSQYLLSFPLNDTLKLIDALGVKYKNNTITVEEINFMKNRVIPQAKQTNIEPPKLIKERVDIAFGVEYLREIVKPYLTQETLDRLLLEYALKKQLTLNMFNQHSGERDNFIIELQQSGRYETFDLNEGMNNFFERNR